jgi:hypothetical protein
LVPLDNEEANRLLADVPAEARGECWWLVLRDGTPVPGDHGGAAALFLELRLTRPLGRLVRATSASALLNAGDRLVARHRGTLGRFVPDGEAPERYP